MRLLIGITVVSGLVFGAIPATAQDAYVVPADTPVNIKRAVESDARTQVQRARDPLRRPAEILMLAGVE